MDEICENMKCLSIFKDPDCKPDQCKHLDEQRKRTGSIYVILSDGSERFVAALPRLCPRNDS